MPRLCIPAAGRLSSDSPPPPGAAPLHLCRREAELHLDAATVSSTGTRMGTRRRDFLLLTAARRRQSQAHRGGERIGGVGRFGTTRRWGKMSEEESGARGSGDRARSAQWTAGMDSARASREARFELLSSARLRAFFWVRWAVLRRPKPS
jgi:hypothetical protein